jgi:hydroxyacylglutathione hydrolase
MGLLRSAASPASSVAAEAEFVRFMIAEIPPAPRDAAALRAINSGSTAAAA